jgi:hypothetical protein
MHSETKTQYRSGKEVSLPEKTACFKLHDRIAGGQLAKNSRQLS